MSAAESTSDLITDVREALATVKTSLARLHQEHEQLKTEIAEHNKRARDCVRQGNDEQARTELAKKQRKIQRVKDLDEEITDLRERRDDLEAKLDKLTASQASSEDTS